MSDDLEHNLEKEFEHMLREGEGTNEREHLAASLSEREDTRDDSNPPTAIPTGLDGRLNLFHSILNSRHPGSSYAPPPGPGASPEEMLEWLRGAFNSLTEKMDTVMPGHQDKQIPVSTLPTFDSLKDVGGNTGFYRVRDVMNSVNDLFNMVSNGFKTMDLLAGSKHEVASTPLPNVASVPSTSNSAAPEPRTQFHHQRYLDSLTEFGSNASQLPSGTSFIANTLTRQYQQNELFIRSSLQTIAIQLKSLPEDDPNYILLQSVFGLSILHLYEITWEKEYLDLGVGITSLAWSEVKDPIGVAHMVPTMARNWSYGQRLSAQDTGDGEKLTMPVNLLLRIYDITKNMESIPSRAKGFFHNELACCLYERYLLLEDLSNLDAAIHHFRIICENDDVSRDKHVHLGHAHLQRFLVYGEMDDLDRALWHAFQAGSSLGSGDVDTKGNPDTAYGLHLIALCYEQKFYLQLDFSYLDKAIEKCRSAMKLVKEAHPLYIRCKSDVALMHLLRYKSWEDTVDLAVSEEELLTAIVLEMPERNTYIPIRAALGMVQVISAKTSVDMDNAIRLLNKARKEYSGPKYIESRIEEFMCHALHRQFNTTKSVEHLQDAVKYARHAIDKTYKTSPRRVELVVDLGHLLMTAYAQDKDLSHCVEAMSHFSWAANASFGPPTARLEAAVEWANAAEECHSETFVEALEYALHLLPSIAWVGNRMPIQYRMLSSQSSPLVSRAAAHAIEHGRLEKAISYLEMGRNVLWAQALQLRIEGTKDPLKVNDMKENEYLAQYISREIHDDAHDIDRGLMNDIIDKMPSEVIEISQSLQASLNMVMKKDVDIGTEDNVKRDTEKLRAVREDIDAICSEASLHNAAARWKDLQEGLQSPGGSLSSNSSNLLEDDHLISIFEQGPVVILNTYKSRCDALILSISENRSVGVRHIPLPDMSGDDALAWAESLREGVYMFETGECTQPDYEETILIPILQGLWRGMVHPIIEDLRTKGKMKERIWWYPTGPLAFLPIHAAGPYVDNEPDLLDLVASSYTPTLHSLIRTSKSKAEPFHLLAVGQPATPGHSALPGVEKEIAAICKQLNDQPDKLTVLKGEEATVYQVTKALPKHTWLHLACHADQNAEYPFHSAFFMHDGPLKLSKLMRLELTRVQFAMLSACLTSAGDATLPDECIHLAAGMQFSGVRSVIATMWTVQDAVAQRTTKQVYHHFLHKKSEEPNPTAAAKGLQLALLDLKKAKIPLSFRVPFIHTGI